MGYNLKEYDQLEEFKYPIIFKSGFTINKLVGLCADCGDELEEVKGEIIYHNNCVEIKLAGLCYACKTLVSCQMRYYNDGRFMQNTDDGWKKAPLIYDGFWFKLKNKIMAFFKKAR